MEKLEDYRKLSKKKLLQAVENRHNRILNAVKTIKSDGKIESFMYNKNELYKEAYHYIFEISVTGADKKYHDTFKKVAKENNCIVRKMKGKNMFVFFTSKFAEYKTKNK